jgi:glyoxylase-like metal-dependent hydrolase (beta-lactamase superfamily II)
VALTASQAEWAEARHSWFSTGPEQVEIKLAHYRRMGFGEDRLAAMRAGGNIFRSPLAPPPETFIAIADGDTIRIDGKDWQVMTFGGHSPEHVCLWCPERSLLIAGDQILPTISPVVGVWPDSPDADPLGLFLAGLDRLRRLPADTLVLPAHGAPFHGLVERCDALIHHHHERLETIARACDSPATVFDILGTVFSRPLDVHQMGFAGAEILAHLNPLVADGRLVRDRRDGGPWTFARA